MTNNTTTKVKQAAVEAYLVPYEFRSASVFISLYFYASRYVRTRPFTSPYVAAVSS